MTPEQKRIKELEKSLTTLTQAVRKAISIIDKEMSVHQDPLERGKKIASATNELELKNDMVRYFALKINLKTGKRGRG
jgi:hypothetical protein